MKKHSVFTRLTGVLLAAVMLVTMIPFASADGEYVLTENYLGEDISYTFDPATGKLTVTGTGRLADWAFDWKDEIQSVEICDGIQSIGDGVFYFCQNLKTVSLPASVVEINSNAFYGTALEEITYGGTEEKFLDIALGGPNEEFINAPVKLADGSYIEFGAWEFWDEFYHRRYTSNGGSQVFWHSFDIVGEDDIYNYFQCKHCGYTYIEHKPFTPSADSSSYEVRAGEEFTVTIYFDNIESIRSVGIWFDYDRDLFEFVGGDCVNLNYVIYDASDYDGFVATYEDPIGPGAVAELTFRAKEYVGDGEYSFIYECTYENADYNMETNWCDNRITVKNYIRGDVDQNEAVNSADAIYLLRHTMRSNKYPINQNGDMNGDYAVNSADAIYLLRHTMRPSKYPLFDGQ